MLNIYLGFNDVVVSVRYSHIAAVTVSYFTIFCNNECYREQRAEDTRPRRASTPTGNFQMIFFLNKILIFDQNFDF